MPFSKLFNLWKKPSSPEETGPFDEVEIEKAKFLKEAKRKMQRLDELITGAELEIEQLSIELDKIDEQETVVRQKVLEIDKEGSHLERSLLMKAKRLQTHGENLKQRIDIYHQNIELYLNMMSRIQDIQAMKMGGIDEEKISTVWLEFKEELDTYKDKLVTASGANEDCKFQIETLENQLDDLRKDIFPEKTPEVAKESLENKLDRKLKEAQDRTFEAGQIDDSEPERELVCE